MDNLQSVFSSPDQILDLAPEDLAGVLIELVPAVAQRGKFHFSSFFGHGLNLDATWQHNKRSLELAVSEAINWLISQGLAMRDPGQSGDWLVLTRRGEKLKSTVDFEAFRKAGILPTHLLPTRLNEKVRPLFMRGDYDVAVFQAFKEVEVSVRIATGFSSELVGRKLMAKAFAKDDGPLADRSLPIAERESEQLLFSGAIGHAKNPTGHRDVNLDRSDAARLIIFASYLLSIVAMRSGSKARKG